jgi:hypothetical protein
MILPRDRRRNLFFPGDAMLWQQFVQIEEALGCAMKEETGTTA